jgi:hypothetical protein
MATKFFPAKFKRYSRTESGVDHHTIGAHNSETGESFVNVHQVESLGAARNAADRAGKAFAAGQFSLQGSENWAPIGSNMMSVPADSDRREDDRWHGEE